MFAIIPTFDLVEKRIKDQTFKSKELTVKAKQSLFNIAPCVIDNNECSLEKRKAHRL
jgi:hypothetical protein